MIAKFLLECESIQTSINKIAPTHTINRFEFYLYWNGTYCIIFIRFSMVYSVSDTFFIDFRSFSSNLLILNKKKYTSFSVRRIFIDFFHFLATFTVSPNQNSQSLKVLRIKSPTNWKDSASHLNPPKFSVHTRIHEKCSRSRFARYLSWITSCLWLFGGKNCSWLFSSNYSATLEQTTRVKLTVCKINLKTEASQQIFIIVGMKRNHLSSLLLFWMSVNMT